MNEIQGREYEVLTELKKIFERHGLRYFAVGGTCIGAIRHKGFIPWDDDIDIGMPGKDFELFRTQYYKELPCEYRKVDGDNSLSHNFLFFKVHDSRTTYVEYYAEHTPDRYTGVFVDIMPVDGLPVQEKQIKNLIKKINLLFLLNSWKRPSSRKGTYKEKMKDFIENILLKAFTFNYFSNKIYKLMNHYDFDTTSKVYFTWRDPAISITRKLYSKEWFASTIEVPFETGTIAVPVGYHEYLTQDFGNYMKLPPKEVQKSVHNIYISDMDRPYSYYVELEKKRYK